MFWRSSSMLGRTMITMMSGDGKDKECTDRIDASSKIHFDVLENSPNCERFSIILIFLTVLLIGIWSSHVLINFLPWPFLRLTPSLRTKTKLFSDVFHRKKTASTCEINARGLRGTHSQSNRTVVFCDSSPLFILSSILTISSTRGTLLPGLSWQDAQLAGGGFQGREPLVHRFLRILPFNPCPPGTRGEHFVLLFLFFFFFVRVCPWESPAILPLSFFSCSALPLTETNEKEATYHRNKGKGRRIWKNWQK